MLENGLTAHACRHTATNARQERVTSVRVRFFSVGHEAKRRASFIRLRLRSSSTFFFLHYPIDESSRNACLRFVREKIFFPSLTAQTRFNLRLFLSLLPVFTFRCFSLVGKKKRKKTTQRGSFLKSFCVVFLSLLRSASSILAQEEKWKKCE